MNLIGVHIGNYVVRRELGAGGMGTVYLAEHPAIGRQVAIKVLHDENAEDPDKVQRFFQEAKAAAEIGHEHIVEIIDVGQIVVDGKPAMYLMMELLDGVSLGTRLREGVPSDDEIRHVLLQCCSALAASHAHGIVHRDLKPENIYLVRRFDDDRFVKVLDFGIAKLLSGRPGYGRTRIGTLLGTPHYMSPEQCKGQGDVDPRSDVYSIGVLLYEMLCGQLPFDGNLGEILRAQVLYPPVPPSSRRPGVSPALEAIALHCLEKDRRDRPQTMDEVAAALRDPAAHLAAWAARYDAARAVPGYVAPARTAPPDAPTVHVVPPVTASVPPLERHVRSHSTLRTWALPLALAVAGSLGLALGSVALRGWLDERALDERALDERGLRDDATIQVTIVSDPPGARVTGHDGGRPLSGTTPLTIERRRDAAALELTLTLPGRPPVTRRLAPTRDTELVVAIPEW